MMTLDPLIHETFNSPLGDSGDVEGHSVIRTENGGCWYADDLGGDDHVAEAHAEIVRRVNLFPELLDALQQCEAAMNTAKEHCYSDGAVHHKSFDTIAIGNATLKARAALGKANKAISESPENEPQR